MTYLNAALLAGLLLAGLPLLIHLIGRKRLKRQPFSTLQFLQKLQIKRMRRLKIRQWIILALRTLAVLFLAMAFLRPAISEVGRNSSGRTDTVVLLDLSASMSARRPEGIPLVSAREILENLLAGNAQDRVAVVVNSSEASRDIAWQSTEQSHYPWLSSLQADGRSTDTPQSFQRVSELLADSDAPNREILWISDFTYASADSLPVLDNDVSLYRVPVAQSTNPVNLSIQSIRFTSPVVTKDATVPMEVVCKQSGGTETISAILTVRLNGRPVAEGRVEFHPERTTVQEFPVSPPQTGYLPGEVEIAYDDALTLDNRYSFVLIVPEKRDVLIVGDDARAIRYISLALDPDNSSEYFNVYSRTGGLSGVELSDYDAIVSAGRVSFSELELRRLREYLENGGGLWLFLGNDADLVSYNMTILNNFGIGSITDPSQVQTLVRRLDEIDSSHPAFSEIFANEGQFDAPIVKKVSRFSTANGARTVLQLSDGTPFLLESQLGEGKIWFVPSAIDTAWTDLPLNGLFAPFLQSGVQYLTSSTITSVSSATCGESAFWPADLLNHVEEYTIVDPLGNEFQPIPSFHNGRNVLMTAQTLWPGIYQLVSPDGHRSYFAMNTPSEESNLLPVSLTGEIGIPLQVTEQESIVQLLRSFRYGKEISIIFLLLSVLCLVAEMILARSGKPSELSNAGNIS